MKNPSACSFPSNCTAITHSHNQQYQLYTTQKWKYREYKHENATVKQKESGLLETIPIHGFKWGTRQMTQRRFVFPNHSITLWTTNPLNIRISIHSHTPRTVPGNDKHHSRQSDEVNEKASIIYANTILVEKIQSIWIPEWSTQIDKPLPNEYSRIM